MQVFRQKRLVLTRLLISNKNRVNLVRKCSQIIINHKTQSSILWFTATCHLEREKRDWRSFLKFLQMSKRRFTTFFFFHNSDAAFLYVALFPRFLINQSIVYPYHNMDLVEETVLDKFRSQVGRSFLAVSRGMTKVGEVGATGWCVFAGFPRLNGNRFLIFKNDKEILERYERSLEELRIPSSGMFAGEGQSLRLNSKWTPRVSTPLMVYDLGNINEDDLPKMQDDRVYTATGADYERVLKCLVESFNMEVATAEESPFALAAKNIDSSPDIKIFLIDDNGKAASIVYAVTVEENSILLAMGTIPDARRKGLAKAILNASFIDAKKQGLSKSVLFASELGKLLYDSVGFKSLEDWTFYVYSPEQC
jgi:GNAT superfamily N-acetyltransferase